MTWWIVTELVNLTDKIIGFEEIWDDGESRRDRRPMALKDLAPNKTKKLVRDIGSYMGTNVEYNIRLLINGKPTGKKLRAYYFVECMRLVFKYDHKDDALLVQCVPEKFTNYTDILFRLKGLGCVLRRKKRWDKRPLIDVELQEDQGPVANATAAAPPQIQGRRRRGDEGWLVLSSLHRHGLQPRVLIMFMYATSRTYI